MGLEGQYVSPIKELKYNWFLHNGCVNVLIRVYPGTQTPLAWPAKKVVRHEVTNWLKHSGSET